MPTTRAEKRWPSLPDAPPPLGRKTVADHWFPATEHWYADSIGARGAEVLTARILVDRNWLIAGRTYLIHVAKKFWAWNGYEWYPADVDDLERSIWAILRGSKSEKRVRAVLYALKFEAAWPPLPAARAA